VAVLQEVHGLTFAATPQQNINVLTLGAPNGKGGFFPNGDAPTIAVHVDCCYHSPSW
jgi:hypothetical protein